jgi:hypothetical protein
MIEIQIRRCGNHRIYSIDCGDGKWCGISETFQGTFVVDYCNKSRRFKEVGNLQSAIQFAVNWYRKTFPQNIFL